MRNSHTFSSQKGFTIIELLIATMVFSVILLLCTTAITQIGRQYYKSTITTRTQEAARSIIDEISQAIQLEGGGYKPQNGIRFCIGDNRYVYKLGAKVDGTNLKAALIHNIDGSCGNLELGKPPAANPVYTPTLDDRSLVPQNMRLADLVITEPVPNLFEIKVRVVYGEDDVLCSPTLASGAKCRNNTSLTETEFATHRDLVCKSQKGASQFCSVSELTTTVQKRL